MLDHVIRLQRLEGVSYDEIAAKGGGIASTVRATRAATEDELFASAEKRLRSLLRDGVTTVEIKSGYGLDLANERKMLRVARRLGEALPVSVRATCLAAHALPPEYKDRADDYIEHICAEMLPALAAMMLVNEGRDELMLVLPADHVLDDQKGTGRRALALGRSDIAGKTGTTNESKDAWFSGYNADYVTTVWTCYDQIGSATVPPNSRRPRLSGWS